MTNSILHSILNGEFFPWEGKFNDDKKLKELGLEIQKHYDLLEQGMSEETKAVFEEYNGLLLARTFLESQKEMTDNFALGLLVGQELQEFKAWKNQL